MTEATAVLRLKVEGEEEFARVMGIWGDSSKRANALITSDAKHTNVELLRLQRELTSKYQSSQATSTRHTTTEARKRTDVEIREGERAQRSMVSNSREFERRERGKTSTVEREESARTRATERGEQARTQIEARASQQRQRQRAAIARNLASLGGSVASAGAGVASELSGQVQSTQRTNADRETALNSILQQNVSAGVTFEEIAASRRAIMAYARTHNMRVDDMIPAIGDAQENFNALGGATPQARQEALNATLENVRFASIIDPTNMTGLTRFGAMLRQNGATPEMQQEILRNTAGISFSGAVEAQDAIRGGLPGMLQSLSANLARDPTGNRQETIRETVADFMAQVQTVAATGGSVRETSGRVGQLRRTLNNHDTQQRLGTALSHRLDVMGHRRNMTDEQRAEYQQMREEFGSTFTRDRSGNYTMNADVANSPSRAAAFLGHQFNNDPTAISNFLGVRGGGGRRQLINRPEVALLNSYYAMDTNGRRQYDAVNDLKRQTISPQQLQMMERLRNSEERTRIIGRENSAHDANTDVQNSWFGRMAIAIREWTGNHPVTTAIGNHLGGLGSTLGLAKVMGGGSAAGGFTMGAFGANVVAGLNIARHAAVSTGLTALAGYGGVRVGEALRGSQDRPEDTLRSQVRRRGVLGTAGQVVSDIGYLATHREYAQRAAGPQTTNNNGNDALARVIEGAVSRGIAQGLINAAPQMRLTVSPTDAAHAAGVANTGVNAPPMQPRN